MPKSLINDLKDLAQEIIQLNENTEIDSLRAKAIDLFEKLTILKYKNTLIKTSEKEKNEIFINQKELDEPEISKEEVISESEQEIEDLFIPTFDSIKEDMSQKEEFRDTISIEETEQFFERKRIERIQKKVIIKKIEKNSKQLSLHDKLLSNTIQIGLNDRIAFVNNLFNFSQTDFNKVLSTLNDFDNKEDAFDFINHTVKPKYNWKGKEDLEERLIQIIERKFL